MTSAWKTVVTAAAIVMINGFSEPNKALGQERGLEVAPYSANLQSLYSDIKAGFEASHPSTHVTLRNVPRDNESVIQQVLREALIGEVADVVFVDSNRLRLFVERDLAQPIDNLIENDASWADSGIPDAALNVGRFGSQIYGLPLGVSIPVVVFNSELVKQAGGDPDNLPSDWPEIIALAKKIDAISPDVVGAFYEWDNTGNFTYMALLGSFGGKLTSSDEKEVAFNSEVGLQALRVLEMFGEAGQARADMTRDQARQLFASGQLGVLVTSNSIVTRLAEQAAEKFQVKAHPFPLANADGLLPAGGPIALILTDEAERKEAAWEFVRYATSSEGQSLLVQHTGYLPINEGALSESGSLEQYFLNNPNARAAAIRLPNLTSWYAFPGDNSIRITDVIKDHLQSVVTLRETPEAALENMFVSVQNLLP